MKNKNQNLEQELQTKLKRQLREHREKLNLRQLDVANALNISLDTYQRWEKPSQSLNNISDILSVFEVLDFSTTEIIDVLGLPPLTSNELEAICQDEDTLKSIKENGVRSAMHESYCQVDDFILEKMLIDILKECLKRLESKHKNL